MFEVGALQRGTLTDEVLDTYAEAYETGDGPERLARVLEGLDGRGLAGREAALAAIDAPVLILWGEDDPFMPPVSADRLNELIPRSGLALLPGCKHVLPEEAPQALAPLLYEYLRSAYAGLPHAHDAGPTTIPLGRSYREE